MLFAILLFVIFFIICAQLNCFIERRREGRHRREIQNLMQQSRRRREETAGSNNNGGIVSCAGESEAQDLALQ